MHLYCVVEQLWEQTESSRLISSTYILEYYKKISIFFFKNIGITNCTNHLFGYRYTSFAVSLLLYVQIYAIYDKMMEKIQMDVVRNHVNNTKDLTSSNIIQYQSQYIRYSKEIQCKCIEEFTCSSLKQLSFSVNWQKSWFHFKLFTLLNFQFHASLFYCPLSLCCAVPVTTAVFPS